MLGRGAGWVLALGGVRGVERDDLADRSSVCELVHRRIDVTRAMRAEMSS
jgi:hypothetical protein